MTPLEYYLDQQARGNIISDKEQLRVMDQLQSIYFALLKEQERRQGLFNRLRNPQLVRGLYLWGGVGIGKTYMMDCFYDTVPFKKKCACIFINSCSSSTMTYAVTKVKKIQWIW